MDETMLEHIARVIRDAPPLPLEVRRLLAAGAALEDPEREERPA